MRSCTVVAWAASGIAHLADAIIPDSFTLSNPDASLRIVRLTVA